MSKIILNRNELHSLIKESIIKLIESSYQTSENEYGEYGMLLDIKYNIIKQYDLDSNEEYEEYRIIEFNTIKNDNIKLNEVCSFYELEDYFGFDTASEMDEYEINESNKIAEYDDKENNYHVIEYACFLKLNDIEELRNKDINGLLKMCYEITDSFDTALWLTDDGTLLDGDEGNGYRTIDHNSIESIVGMNYEDAMKKIGVIRLMPESPGFELHRLPTYQQEEVLAKFIRHFNNETIYIDFGNNISASYSSPHHYSRILSDIEDYFTEGKKPLLYN